MVRAMNLVYRFKKTPQNNSANLTIKLISIHIPKTAGSSFHEVLKNVYDKNTVFYVSRDDVKKADSNLKRIIPEKTTVLHGHFKYFDIRGLYNKKGTRVIAWLREPVERVISNYYFFINRIRSDATHKNFHRKNETLLEYARRDGTRNRMYKFLDGINLINLFYFGIVEHFDEDLITLGQLLDWNHMDPVHLNSNKEFKLKFGSVSKEIRKEIRKLNKKDVVLYKKALSLRKKRLRNGWKKSSM